MFKSSLNIKGEHKLETSNQGFSFKHHQLEYRLCVPRWDDRHYISIQFVKKKHLFIYNTSHIKKYLTYQLSKQAMVTR